MRSAGNLCSVIKYLGFLLVGKGLGLFNLGFEKPALPFAVLRELYAVLVAGVAVSETTGFSAVS